MMQQLPTLYSRAPSGTGDIVRAVEEYVREVAHRSRRSARQVEPVIEATLTVILEQSSSESWTRYFRQFRNMLAHDARLWESYERAGDQRAQILPELLGRYLMQGTITAPHRPGQAESVGAGSRPSAQQHASSIERLSTDLVATIAAAGLVLMEAKAWREAAAEPVARSAENLTDLERENMLRVFDSWQELLGRSLGGPELARRLGVSRQRLSVLRREGRLLGLRVPIRRELHYPVWQFGEDGRPLAALPRLLEAAREVGLHPRDLDALMVSADAGEGKPPIEHLRAGEEAYVLGVIRAAGE
jgi:hypothetical protein